MISSVSEESFYLAAIARCCNFDMCGFCVQGDFLDRAVGERLPSFALIPRHAVVSLY